MDYRTILTSAHCVTAEQSGDVFDKFVEVFYFDPVDGNPAPRTLHFGNAHIKVHPPYSGIGDYQSDIAVIHIDGSWNGVTIYDNIRIYNEGINVQGQTSPDYTYFWGAGFNSNNGTGQGTLRKGFLPRTASAVGTYYMRVTSLYTPACYGDSGGPYFRADANVNFAISLFSTFAPNPNCNEPSGPEWSTRIAPKIPWVMSVAPITCNYMKTSQTGTKYIRCF